MCLQRLPAIFSPSSVAGCALVPAYLDTTGLTSHSRLLADWTYDAVVIRCYLPATGRLYLLPCLTACLCLPDLPSVPIDLQYNSIFTHTPAIVIVYLYYHACHAWLCVCIENIIGRTGFVIQQTFYLPTFYLITCNMTYLHIHTAYHHHHLTTTTTTTTPTQTGTGWVGSYLPALCACVPHCYCYVPPCLPVWLHCTLGPLHCVYYSHYCPSIIVCIVLCGIVIIIWSGSD